MFYSCVKQENGGMFGGDGANGEGEELEEKSVDDDEAEGDEEEEDDSGDGGTVQVHDFDDDEEDEEGDDEGVAVSNFVWQACYPAKLNQSFSMEVIEEECEEDGLEVSIYSNFKYNNLQLVIDDFIVFVG